MKKAIKILTICLLIPTIYLLSAALSATFPSSAGYSQNEAISAPDISITLEQAKALLQTADQNQRTVKGMEAISAKTTVIVKKEKVYVPGPVRYRSKPVAENKKDPEPNRSRPAVTVIYEAPKYPGTEIRDKMTFAEWKMQRGLLQGKSYRLYEIYLNEK